MSLIGSELPVEQHAPRRHELLYQVHVGDVTGQQRRSALQSLQEEDRIIHERLAVGLGQATDTRDDARDDAGLSSGLDAGCGQPMGGNALDYLADRSKNGLRA